MKKHQRKAQRCTALGCNTITMRGMCLKHRHVKAQTHAAMVLRKLAASATVH